MFSYPLLREVFELYAEADLDNVLVLAVQHLLNDQLCAFDLLLKAGLRPENCLIVGKNYSANVDVVKALREKGCLVAPFSTDFDPERGFDGWFEEKLTAFLRQELGQRNLGKYRKIIILDDGGFMHLAINELCGHLPNIVGIEQTSSGYHKIRQANIRFPTLSVARIYHKQVCESPLIAQNGYERIAEHLQSRSKSTPNILVFGLGAIGRQIAGRLFLTHGHQGMATDCDLGERVLVHGVSQMLISRGLIIPLSEAMGRLGQFDVIIGTTGSTVLTECDVNRLHPRVSLISLSSSDREFPATFFRKKTSEIHDNCWKDTRCLVNGGFPITFDGTAQAMPPNQIELTVAIMFTCLLNELGEVKYPLSIIVNRLFMMWKPD